jgi:hypothetical protein
MTQLATLVFEVMQTERPGEITRLVGLDVDQEIASGKTALAISLEGGAVRDHQPVTHELLRAGARSLGAAGPALPRICASGVPELLLAYHERHPAEVDADPDARRVLAACRGAVQAPEDGSSRDPYPTLLVAIRAGSADAVRALLAAGYRADERWGASPARIAARLGHPEVAALFETPSPDRAVLDDAIRADDRARIDAWLSSGTPDVAHVELAVRLGRQSTLDAILARGVVASAGKLGDLARALARDPDERNAPEARPWKQRGERNGRVMAALSADEGLVADYLDWERDGRVALIALSLLPGASPIAGTATKPCLAVGHRFVQLEKLVLRVTRCASAAEAEARLPKARAKSAKSAAPVAPAGAISAELTRLGASFGPGFSGEDLTPIQLLLLATWPDGARYRSRLGGTVALSTAAPHETIGKRWHFASSGADEALFVDDGRAPHVHRTDHETGRVTKGEKLIDFLRGLEPMTALD